MPPFNLALVKIRMHFAFGGFADGRSETSPDSEGIEPTVAKPQRRNFPSVEQIQDSGSEPSAELVCFLLFLCYKKQTA